jgi:hypothetical protein
MGVEWQYAHFQAVSRAGNRYAVLLGSCVVLGWLVLASRPGAIPSDAILSLVALSGVAGTLAFCGQHRRGRQVVAQIKGTTTGDLESIDEHPSMLDFFRYARGRGAPPYAAWLLPMAATTFGFLWFLYLWGYAVGIHWPARSDLLVVDAVTALLAALTTGPLTGLWWSRSTS